MKDSEDTQLNFSINPDKTPILAVDGYLITSSPHFLTLSFAQGLPGGNQQQVVARVALSPKQAKEFLLKLDDHIQKFEV